MNQFISRIGKLLKGFVFGTSNHPLVGGTSLADSRAVSSSRVVDKPRNLPAGFKALPADDRVQRARVFDPAVLHMPGGYRHGEPVFADSQTEREWRLARQRMLKHSLGAVAKSHWGPNLVLRGSTLLWLWFPDVARDPGDVDWVVHPTAIMIDNSWTRSLFDALPTLLSAELPPGFRIDQSRTAIDEIWAYERNPGKRLTVVWYANGLPPGTLQFDFVFGEELWEPPGELEVVSDNNSVRLTVATKAQSLAWKLLWLDTDLNPQGKDLYDAVILAESTVLSWHLLGRSFELRCKDRARRLRRDFANVLVDFDWDNFQAEFPYIKGNVEEWRQRLINALQPSFEGQEIEQGCWYTLPSIG